MTRTHAIVHAVDPARLQPGTWCHERDRCIGEGDIYASYSADRIGMDGTVRRPFRFQGQFWVTTSISGRRTDFTIEAYRLMPIEQFDGIALAYHEKTHDPEAPRNDPMGFYHGMRVRQGRFDWVLVGSPVRFVKGREVQRELFAVDQKRFTR